MTVNTLGLITSWCDAVEAQIYGPMIIESLNSPKVYPLRHDKR